MGKMHPEEKSTCHFHSFTAIKRLHPLDESTKEKLLQSGLSIEMLTDFMEVAELDVVDLCYVLGISGHDYRRLRNARLLPREESLKVLALVELYALGYTLFGDRKMFNYWIKTNNESLGKIPAFSILNRQEGGRELRGILKSIKHGALL